MIAFDAVLSPAELAEARTALAAAQWISGRTTAGWQAADVKQNGQLAEDDKLARRLGDVVTRALEACKPFIAAALPLRLYPPMFNRYVTGQTFGPHVDTAIRQVPGAPIRVRADLSATLFLSEPGDYEGGELIVQDGAGGRAVKLPAGSLVLYGAGTVHAVEPVRAGERLGAFMWIQSMVRDAGQRALLHELDGSIQTLAGGPHDAAGLVRLTGVYHNLLRRWADC